MKTQELIREGKTKKIWRFPQTTADVLIESKDDVTAGDGARREQFDGKGASSTTTTVNCFRLLTAHGIPNHFIAKAGDRTFRARQLRMIPIEVVTRRLATGSYLKRHHNVEEGERFDPLIVEFFDKNDSRHDPLIVYDFVSRRVLLFDAKKPLAEGLLEELPMVSRDEVMFMTKRLIVLAEHTFLILEKAWAEQEVALVDLKIECGYDVTNGEIVVGDVITNDEWRIWPGGEKGRQLDKQVFREMRDVTVEAMAALKATYAKVAKMTSAFRLPQKEWRGIITTHSTADP
ncbi:MAG: phosphoribosylaminoimidazolesuccinocarboxamide synthase [Candidatus Sungbacteria bacterium]|uniref:Phosphoribosylaminoimidazole-succinocarboxamide synthase n=1 Tax=Candidatus Sungiibacteriota bacterium TaxID=2750080 RepID=A0A932YZ40_9BACT|nr:phosphoribosylaminoimidazolesuccinocarboxamide synthase [Candidatus Sungbacteria bacterium]